MVSAMLTLLDSSVPRRPAARSRRHRPSRRWLQRNSPSVPRAMRGRWRIDELDAADGRDRSSASGRAARPRPSRRAPIMQRGVRRHGDRTGVAQHRIAAGRHQLAVGIDVQIAGARVGFGAVAGLHGDPARALDRDIQVASGCVELDAGARSQPTVTRRSRRRAKASPAPVTLCGLERRQIGAKAGRAGIGQVVVVRGLARAGFPSRPTWPHRPDDPSR